MLLKESKMEIETKRLNLREFSFGDWHAVLEYQSVPRYQRFYLLTNPSPEDIQKFVSDVSYG